MGERNLGFNIESGSGGGFAYSAEQQHGNRKDLFVDIKIANKNRELTLKNMLIGTSNAKGLNFLIEAIQNNTLNEADLKNSLELLPGGIAFIRRSYTHPIIDSVRGRIVYLLREKNKDLKGYDIFIEADKIAKDLLFYIKESPNDILLESEKSKPIIQKMASDFQNLINLYMESSKGIYKPTGEKITIHTKSNQLTDENFKNQIIAVCLEASDTLMDLESSLVSKNFSEMNILINDLKNIENKNQTLEKLMNLKSLIEKELSS